jgi:hypothetical protein
MMFHTSRACYLLHAGFFIKRYQDQEGLARNQNDCGKQDTPQPIQKSPHTQSVKTATRKM